MDQNELLEKTGRSIIKRMYQHYTDKSLDDMEFIPFVKAVMLGVEDQLTVVHCSKDKRDDIQRILKLYCAELYVSGWVKNREAGETTAEAQKKGEKYFEYLFKHGKHPSWK